MSAGGEDSGADLPANPTLLDCAIVVVTHNSESTWNRAKQAIDALQPAVAECCVVDNASAHAPALGEHSLTHWQLLRNRQNVGFAHACNQGAAATHASWIVFLNPDCFPAPGDIQRLIQCAESVSTIGVLGAQLVNADGSLQAASSRDAPTPGRLLRRPGSLSASKIEMLSPGVQRVDAVSGALMLIRRRVFEQLGGFDHGYRLHCEDLDLCRRIQLAGYQVAFASEVAVTHVKGTSSQARPVWVEWQKHRGMWRYYSKFDRADSPFGLSALVLIALCLRFPLSALRAWWQARRA